MSRRRTIALLVAAASLLAVGAVMAQRTYRGVELMPQIPLPEPAEPDRPAEFRFARLVYTDKYAGELLNERPWHIDSPAAERHFLQGLARLSAIDASPIEHYVKPEDEDFFDYPWLYCVEPGHWDLTEIEAARLREYLLRGGFLVFDDFHGSVEWAEFQNGIRKILPERDIREISPADEVFHVLYDLEPKEQIPGIQMLYTGRTYERDGYTPHWRGIYDDEGRLMVLINWNMDLGDAWEHADWPEYAERYTAMAYRLAINYINYSMTH